VKYRKRILLLIVLPLVALLGAAGWLGGTTAGLRFIVARALPLLPVTVEIDLIEGRLVGPIVLGRLDFVAPGASGEIARVELDWRPAALLGRTLHIDALRIIEPRIEWLGLESSAAPGEAGGGAGGPFSLPVDVTLDHVAISDGTLRTSSEVVVEGVELALSGAASGRELTLRSLQMHSSRGEVTGRAHVSLDPAQPWDIDLEWQLAVQDTSFAGHTRLTGLPSELGLAQDISAPLVARLDGTVRGLPDTPSWALDLVVEPLPANTSLWPEVLDGFSARLDIDGDIEDSLVAGDFELPAYLAGSTGIEAQGGWVENIARLRSLELSLQDGATLSGNGWFEPTDTPAAEFMLSGDGLGWPLDGGAREIDLPRMQLRGAGAGNQWDINADASVRRDGLPELEVEALVHWAGTLLTVESLRLRSADEAVSASASGVLDTGEGRLAYRVAASGDARLPDLPPLALELEAEGDAQGLRVETLSADLLGGTVGGAGRIAWAGGQAADFRLEFADLDPAALAPAWPGRLAGTLELDGLPAAANGLEVTLSSLRGELKSLPVSGDASLNIGAGEYLLRSATIALGEASLEASGRLDDVAVSLAAALDIPALEQLYAEGRGKLSASASITGARATPRIELTATGERLRWGTSRARVLDLDATVDLSGAAVSNVVAEMKGFALRPGRGASVRLEAGGFPQDHRARLELERPYLGQAFLVTLEGNLAGQHWSALLNEIILSDEELPVWSLQAPARLEVDSGAVSLAESCMDGTFGLFCVEGAWNRTGPWRGSATLSRLDLDPLSRRFGDGLLATGVLTGKVDIQADDELFRSLSGGLELTAGEVRPADDADKLLLSWLGGSLELTGDDETAVASLSVKLSGDDHVDGHVADGWNAADAPVDGRFDAEFSQLQLLPILLPELAELQGDARMYAVVAGTLGAPVVEAGFSLQDGSVDMPTLGLRPSDLQANATLGAGGELSFKVTGRSGTGTFESAGRFDLAADGVEGRATLKGENVLLANLAEAQVAASPDLKFRYSGRELAIGGEVEIPFARITELGGATAISTSPDEVLVGARAPAEDEGMRVTSRVRVSVGPDVQVNAAGLRGNVEGSILTVFQPEMLPWGRGELRVVDGTFGVFGQRLEIQTGRLIYTGGPLENPGLEIRAVRRVDDVTAGALVRGTLQQPEISVYSDPPMPRADALSYLTIGRSLSDLQSGERRTVNQAANSLALSGGNLIAGDLGKRLGFDEVAITGDGTGEGASLVLSRYMGGGLYVGYGLGLFDTVNTLRLRFQINRRLSLETISGDEHAGDLFYTFERD
jgi:translocation and assembly module TamB